MSYAAPMCRNCETPLCVVEEHSHQHLRKIESNGKIGRIEKRYSLFTTNKVLKCVGCSRVYEMKLDGENRIVRGRQVSAASKRRS